MSNEMTIIDIFQNKNYATAVNKFKDYLILNNIVEITNSVIHKFFDELGYVSSIYIVERTYSFGIMEVKFNFHFIDRKKCELQLIESLFGLYEERLKSEENLRLDRSLSN